ncbi:hypothetical protein [Actibacterium sp. 188UL27-1]|uniref:hypothetical protein n=1 Tax=Actibacterium sp. 188UL27-1 TaxID=2786961 RepID=UPI00195BF389|nr:hypothetical protein [Actibacterium sp. 188UL27-1]MBM7069195.1 hypothetical protein [Actibacterium sp. 188UL27-1]
MANKAITTDSTGWLRVKLSGGTIISLPKHLKVDFTGRSGGRDHFKIMEKA